MKYGTQLNKIRRFLRDPTGKIWDDEAIRLIYNDIQRDVQHSTGYLQNIKVLPLPPKYQWSYFYDWEWRYIGDNNYQCLRRHEQGKYIFCNLWEMQGEYGNSGIAAEAGSHFIHTWEAWADTPGDVVINLFPHDFNGVKHFSYNGKPLAYAEKKYVSEDSTFETRAGEPRAYYKGSNENTFIIYPRPETVPWNDVTIEEEPLYITAFSWEEGLLTGSAGVFFTRTSVQSFIFDWEADE